MENTWKFRPTPRGKHMEIWWKVKQILTWIPCGNTWKTRGIHAEIRWSPRGIHVEIMRKRSRWKSTRGKDAYHTRNPHGIDVEIRRKSSGSRHVEKTCSAYTLHKIYLKVKNR